METIQDSVMNDGAPSDALPPAAAQTRPSRVSLPPKGSCWYCDKPVDSVRRFCGKDCTDAFDEEAEYTR
ncbi:hypothetical protein ACHAC9_16400 [Massilia sp. CMS3.1]|uniref:hypothetical protein n=1 Tax=Massilia sp. CMS3.1 TaxID=3373083 RepID=UPI003EE698CA